jgi:YggT family protein
VAEIVLLVVRGAVALCCGAFAIVAATHWAVTNGHLSPFGAWARGIRELSEPVIRPTEVAVTARGGDPRQAPYWLLGAAVLGGLVLLSLTQALIGFAYQLQGAGRGGVKGVLYFLIMMGLNLLSFALLVRAIGSWFGFGRWTPWMRPFHTATEWMIGPLKRVIPPFGAFDLTPVAALLIINWVLRPLVAAILR